MALAPLAVRGVAESVAPVVHMAFQALDGGRKQGVGSGGVDGAEDGVAPGARGIVVVGVADVIVEVREMVASLSLFRW